MIDVLDAPFPFLIGIESSLLDGYLSAELGPEVTQVRLDAGSMHTFERITETVRMPHKELRILREKLLRATAGIKVRPSPLLEQVDHAFKLPSGLVDESQSCEVDDLEVRDAFLEFMSRIMSDYKRFFKDVHREDGQMPERVNSTDCFSLQKFRQAKDGTKPDSFMYKFTDATIFGNFIEARSLGTTQYDEQILYFDEC